MSEHYWFDKHMKQSRKSLLKAFYATAGIFAFLFVLFHIGGALYVSSLASSTKARFDNGIAAETARLKSAGDAVAANPLVSEYLESGQYDKLLALMQQERVARNIGLMGVTNSQGITVDRTRTGGRVGDNVFLTNPVGRLVSQGKSVESIEAPFGFDPHQVFLNTGRPIISGGKMIGALFANVLFEDSYAAKFRDAYLPSGTQVLFYRKDLGIYGDSFSDQNTRKLISSYFNSSSDWVHETATGQTLSFDGSGYYLVENVVFPGLQGSPGGALLLIPRAEISTAANEIAAVLALAIFIALSLFYHVRTRKEEKTWRYSVQLILWSSVVFLAVFFVLFLQNSGFVKLERIPYQLYNSTMRLEPDAGVYDLGFEERFTVFVDTGDEEINTAAVGLRYDPQAVDVEMLDTASSSCSYFIEKTIDPTAGDIRLSCVILNDQPGQESLPLADVVVRTKRTGTFDLSFDPAETKVLANDGLGTNVLRMSQSGSYSVGNFDPTLDGTVASSSSATSSVESFVVFSPSHPNQSRWYNSPNASFVWRGKPGQVYRYSFDGQPDSIPTAAHTTEDTSVSIPVPGDGIFYFHLQLASGGPVANYRVQVDQTPPAVASIHLSSDKIVVGDVVRFSFDAQDAGSGVQNNYYVNLGNHLFLPVGSQLYVPFLVPGDQVLTLRVYDDAGNYTEKSQTVHVEPLQQ